MLKQVLKKISQKVHEESKEFLKDSAEQLGKAVSPLEMYKQATGSQGQENEFKKYLENVGDKNLTAEQLKQKTETISQSDSKKKEHLRLYLQSVAPHLRPKPKAPEPRPYEVTIQEMERKKAAEAEAQKQQQPLVIPTSKQARGALGKSKRPNTSDIELSKNAKAQ